MNPSLNEGDQVLKINGRNIGKWSQAEISAALLDLNLKPENEIILTILPNGIYMNMFNIILVYRCGAELSDEQLSDTTTEDSTLRPNKFIKSPQSIKATQLPTVATKKEILTQQRVAETIPRSEKLTDSLRLIHETLNNGILLKQFEQIYRKKPGMTMTISRELSNLAKNRYRDVCPYDATRVILRQSEDGNDYINANHVNVIFFV